MSAQASEQIARLQAENLEYRTSLEGLEKERDFYFAKLRDIEILAQAQTEKLEEAGTEDETLKEIQKILYSTEVRSCVCYRSFDLWSLKLMAHLLLFYRTASRCQMQTRPSMKKKRSRDHGSYRKLYNATPIRHFTSVLLHMPHLYPLKSLLVPSHLSFIAIPLLLLECEENVLR